MTNLQKLAEIKNALNAKYFEREKEVEAILIALISRQHMLMIGPPGTGKSALAADIAKIVTGMNHFQWLLTRFSTPEELFGPLSLKDLEQGYISGIRQINCRKPISPSLMKSSRPTVQS